MTRVFHFVIILLLFTTPTTMLGQLSSQQIKEYIELNNAELRLPDFKDSELDLKLKLDQLHIINMSRTRYRAKPVKLDILASRVANKMCREAAENGFTGHWNLAGEKPYHRYAFAGGVDHVSENASGEMTTGRYKSNPKAISDMMIVNHNAFMNERKPNDGHKQTVIDKNHNFVGIGFQIEDKNTAYYELYIDRYYEFGPIPEKLNVIETMILNISSSDKLHISVLLAYYEKFPRPMTPRQIESRSSYDDYTDKIALQILPWEIEKYKSGDVFSIPLSFDKEGLYYLQIFSDTKPYKEGSTFSTEGKIQASGVVIRVEN